MTDQKSLSRKDFKDYEFILAELARMAKMNGPDLLEHYKAHPEDALYCVPHPQGGEIPFTRSGQIRFLQIVNRGLRALGAAGKKYDRSEIIQSLKAVVMLGSETNPPVTETNAHDLFGEAIRKVHAELKPLTHHVPCVVVAHQKPERFQIGPVQLVRRDVFLKENEDGLRAAQEAIPGYEWGFEALRQFFNQFGWVASVEIEAADPDVSKYRARKTIQSALDLVKLVVGSGRGAGIGQGYDHRLPTRTANLVSSEKGFAPSWGSKMHEAILNEEWYEIVSRFPGWAFAQRVLDQSLETWEDPLEPNLRWLDALRWHGDAIGDPEPRSQLVKFWIAIERAVSLRSNDEVTRKAAMLSSRDKQDFSSQFARCERLYGKRSAVAHGSAAKLDTEEARELSAETELVSRTVLMSYLGILERLHEAKKCDIEGLKTEFTALDTQFRK